MKKIVYLSCAASLLSGCWSPEQNALTNTAPVIKGTPVTSVTLGQVYRLDVIAYDPDGDELSFVIDNKPSWATFDEVTGTLSGTPDTVSVSSNIRVGVSDGLKRSYLPVFDITVLASQGNSSTEPSPAPIENGGSSTVPPEPVVNNAAPSLSNQTIDVVQSVETVITLGAERDADGDSLTYSVANSLNVQMGPGSNKATYMNNAVEHEVIAVSVTDNINAPVTGEISVNVKSNITSNYVTSKNVIQPEFGALPPAKGESRIDPTTGAKITRLTDASEMVGTADALIVYSRYTPENSSGQYILSFGANSTSVWLIDRTTTQVVRKILHTGNKEIGEVNEIRWDTSGAHPNRIYYRYNLALYMIDDVAAATLQPTLIKDFTGLVPAAATKIYNDVEGDSSNDSDHWAFMAAHYNGTTYVVDAFVHYQISQDKTHVLLPSDLAGTPLAHYATQGSFPRPNMVEISPLGTGIILHYGRAWGDANYGSRSEDIGTWFDGAHMWPLDFDHSKTAPVKVSVGETHSGWAFDDAGRELFISQNNRTDKLDAIYVNGVNAGYDNRIEVASHSDFGWSNGFHYGKMPASKKGWIFVNTYANAGNAASATDWAANQLLLMQLKPESANPVVWRISPNYNRYTGNYRDEAPAAINLQGNRIYVSDNWGGNLPNREIFVFELPSDWDQALQP
ncbi:MAG: hypothetical protein H7A09_04185 [Oceanospirillaceae bacterium]|nr:hypothetical protein [Oceanospirillaceae bacterium]MCP5335214.1 hypothetical protein [Oceanospirillaceae bacterium]